MISQPKRFFLHAAKHPCTENAMNLNLLRRWFRGNGWQPADSPSDADITIVSTCGFTKGQEDYEIETIERFNKVKKAGARLIVLGCLPKMNRARLEAIFSGDTVQTENIERFDQILGLDRKTSEFHNHFVSEHEYATDLRMSVFFKIRRFLENWQWLPFLSVPRVLYTVPSEKWWCVRCAMGCTGNCSYCAIDKKLFRFTSQSPGNILGQVREGVSRGFQEIALTGEDLGGYGVDIGTDLPYLLGEILRIPGDFQVNLRYIDPVWLLKLLDKLLPIFETGRIKAFCTPTQSGSNRILKLMNRPYTFERIKKAVNTIMRETRVGMISTELIVGFPTETEEDIEASLRLIHEVDFCMYQVHKYEERPEAKSAGLADKVPPDEMERRFRILHRAAVRKHARSLLFG